MCCNESYSGVITLLKQPFTPRMNALQDNELLNLRIRLTELTQVCIYYITHLDKMICYLFDTNLYLFCSEWIFRVVHK